MRKKPKVDARFLDRHGKNVQIHLHYVPERLVVICWNEVGPAAGGGTPVKPPKKIEIKTEKPPIPRPNG